MEPSQSRGLEASRKHFTQKSIVPGVEDHRLVEMKHVIVRIGRVVVHGEGWYREAVEEGHNPKYVDRGEGRAYVVVLEGRRRKTCVGR